MQLPAPNKQAQNNFCTYHLSKQGVTQEYRPFTW